MNNFAPGLKIEKLKKFPFGPKPGSCVTVFVIEIKLPRLTHRGMTITKVRGIAAGQHALGNQVAAGNHNVELAKVHLLDHCRIKRHIIFIPLVHSRQALRPADGRDIPIAEIVRNTFAVVNERIDRRIGEKLVNLTENLFRAARLHKKIVDKHYLILIHHWTKLKANFCK